MSQSKWCEAVAAVTLEKIDSESVTCNIWRKIKDVLNIENQFNNLKHCESIVRAYERLRTLFLCCTSQIQTKREKYKKSVNWNHNAYGQNSA